MNLLLLFGASGDIHKRKVYPGLFEMYMQDIIHKEFPIYSKPKRKTLDELNSIEKEENKFQVFGISRTRYTQTEYHELIEKSIEDYFPKRNFSILLKNMPKFKKLFTYITIPDYNELHQYLNIKSRLSGKGINKIIIYCGLPDKVSINVIKNITKSNFQESYNLKFLVEKPLGNNLNEYNENIAQIKNFLGDNIDNLKLIDHYLAKTSLINLKPIKSLSSYNQLEKIEIVLYETYLVDNRISYFDSVGLINDVFQSHMMSIFEKLIDKEYDLINMPIEKKGEIGQYNGYPGDQKTETYFKFTIVWNNIPIIFKSGKKMSHNDKSIKFHLKDKTVIEYPILSNQNEYYIMFKSIIENEKNNEQYFLSHKQNEIFWCITNLVKEVLNKNKIFTY